MNENDHGNDINWWVQMLCQFQILQLRDSTGSTSCHSFSVAVLVPNFFIMFKSFPAKISAIKQTLWKIWKIWKNSKQNVVKVWVLNFSFSVSFTQIGIVNGYSSKYPIAIRYYILFIDHSSFCYYPIYICRDIDKSN